MDEEANNESLHSLFQITLYLVSSPYPTMLRGNTIIWGEDEERKKTIHRDDRNHAISKLVKDLILKEY